jgi:phthalate 4,5-dioxygenase
MLTQENARLITEVGPDKPMGRLLREYWIPIVRAACLVAGGAPRRATILHQRLVAYRSPDGTVGVMNEACPHRGASMALARNEKGGLRCVYHGWKICHDGTLLEAPTHAASSQLTHIATGTYPAREAAGMVWAYLGSGTPPALPKLSFMSLPDDHVGVVMTKVRCSWLNMFESLWDSFHAQFLHSRTNRVIFAGAGRGREYFSDTKFDADQLAYDETTMSAALTEYGMQYENDDTAKRTTFAHVMPWFVHHPVGPRPTDDQACQGYVPIDDDHSLLIQWMFNPHAPLKADGYAHKFFDAITDPDDFASGLPRDGVWGQDREAIAQGSYHGLPVAGVMTIPYEDIAMGESQGRLDRTKENLGASDLVVIRGRTMLLEAVKAHQRGEPPLALNFDATQLRATFTSKASSAKEPA